VAGGGPGTGPWPEPANPGVVQTGAWILPDERPLPVGLEAFLDAGPPPVYVGFGSMRAPQDIARVAIEAIRAQGRRAQNRPGARDPNASGSRGRHDPRRRGDGSRRTATRRGQESITPYSGWVTVGPMAAA
jgi:hypothetical protein